MADDFYMKLSDYVIQFLEEKGIDTCFMVAGGGAMHLNDSLGHAKSMKYVPMMHEQAAAIAADSYARVHKSGVGFCMVTSGPGGTNVITGLAGSWLDSIPVIFISGQVKRSDIAAGVGGLRQNGFQELNIIDIVRPLTKYCEQVMYPLTIRFHLEKAWRLAISGRPGPVWLDIPLDVQATQIDPDQLQGYVHEDFPKMPVDKELKAILEILQQAKRPVILLGNGVRLSVGGNKLQQAFDNLKIPILTTWGGIDLVLADHPYLFGRANILGGQRAAHFILQNADVILSVGARLGIQQIGYNYKAFARGAKLLMVDIDGAELHKPILSPYLTLQCQASHFLHRFLIQMDKIPIEASEDWMEYCQTMKMLYPLISKEDIDQQVYCSPYILVHEISKHAKENDVIVPSSSATAYIVSCQLWRIKAGQRFLTSRGMAAMGWDIPSAIGACIGSGKKDTICITGDGSIQLNIQELQTIINQNLPIKIFVLYDGGYATIRNTQKNYFNSNFVGCGPDSSLRFPDLVHVADAYKLATEQIEDHTQLWKVKSVLDTVGPVFCNVWMSPDQQITPRLASSKKEDGTMVSKPLEDLHPFLDRQEFRNNMLIPIWED